MAPSTELRALACVAVIVAALFQAAAAKNYDVGGPAGSWDLSTNFQAWALGKTFSVGDALIFIYDSSHDVVEVTKSDYDSCTVTDPIQAFASGNTVISLLDTGKLYFLCSVPGHCDAGMKVEIDVVAANSAASPPPPKLRSPRAPLSPTVSPPAPKAKSPRPPKQVSPPAPSTPITLPPNSAPAPAPGPSMSISPSAMSTIKSEAAAGGGGKLVRAAAMVGAGILVVMAL